jgi:DNA-binding response OmpR family regulator
MAKVLLIEPDGVLARTYIKALEFAGHSVVQARSAQQAIDAVDAGKPDIVVLELQLVTHDGIEFLHELRSYSEWQDVPVIVLSGLTRGLFEQARQTLQRDFGVQHCLYKPRTSLEQLTRIITEVTA